MGLDMYLTFEAKVPEGTPLFKTIEEGLTDDHRAQMTDPDEESRAYVSDWSWPGKEPEALYESLCTGLRYTPHEGSPHFSVKREPDGFQVEAMAFYWRKANAIHRWFVEQVQKGVDECQRSRVHAEQLADLLDRCQQVAADHDLAEELLPTEGGFFFGSTDYDDWYFENIEDTARELKARIALAPRGAGWFYRASW